jgi:hypothetical protein
MYSIWTSRNNITHEKVGFNPKSTMELLYATLQTWICQGAKRMRSTIDRLVNEKTSGR